MTQRDKRDRNMVDAYLKTVGKDRTPEEKEELRAVRDSVLSIYRLSELEPPVLHDLVRGGSVTLTELPEGLPLEAGDGLAARVIEVGGERRLTKGLLLLVPDEAASLAAGVRTEIEKIAGKPSAAQTDYEVRAEGALRFCCPLITSAWLGDRLEDSEGLDDIQLATLVYDFAPENATEIRRRIETHPLLTAASDAPDTWNWLGEDGEDLPLITIMLNEEEKQIGLPVEDRSAEERARGFIAGMLGDLVGPGSKDEWSVDQIEEVMELLEKASTDSNQ
jgi:hypothetical protein